MSVTPQEAFDKIGEQLAEHHPVKPSKMFGMLCLKVEKKAFASIMDNAMADAAMRYVSEGSLS